MTNTQQSIYLEWAKWHASRGFRVFPITPNMKSPPLIERWPERASTDAAQISEWWTKWPDANIGIATGKGWTVLDIDPRKDGCLEALSTLEQQHGVLPTTSVARTPSGGEHRYFTGEDVRSSASKVGPGLDIKSRGGYVVAAPSYTVELRNERGEITQREGRYELVDLNASVAPTPSWLVVAAGAMKVASHSEVTEPMRIPSGARNSTLRSIAGKLYHTGLSESAVLAALERVNEEQCDEQLDSWEVEMLARPFRNGRREQQAWEVGFGASPLPAGAIPLHSAASASRFATVTTAELMSAVEPQWRIRGLLQEQGSAMLFGPSNSGKSFVALDIAMSICRGRPFGHQRLEVRPGEVVYIAAEAPASFIKRLRAYVERHGDGPGPRFVTVAPNMLLKADVVELNAAIGHADVVIIDTLHAVTPGADENSAKDMGEFLGNCRSLQSVTGGLVMWLHHPGKDEARGARGSSSLYAAVDTELGLSRVAGGLRRLTVTKQRNGETGAEFFFNLDSVELAGPPNPSNSCVVHYVEKPGDTRKAHRKLGATERAIVDAVRALGATQQGRAEAEAVYDLVVARTPFRRDNAKRSAAKLTEEGILAYHGGCFFAPAEEPNVPHGAS